MFTVEMDFDEVAITILDDTGQYEDVQFFIYDDIVYIRQYFEQVEAFSVIAMTPEMFEEFRKSFDKPEGAYITRSVKK
jgi:hypothetical protein